MNGEQLLEYVRTVDPVPILNYEMCNVLIIGYFNESGQPVVAIATRDGRHRIVMVSGKFVPRERTILGDDDPIENEEKRLDLDGKFAGDDDQLQSVPREDPDGYWVILVDDEDGKEARVHVGLDEWHPPLIEVGLDVEWKWDGLFWRNGNSAESRDDRIRPLAD